MEERKQFFYLNLRKGEYNGVKYQRLDFIDDNGDKYSASCPDYIASIIEDMNIPKFAPIDIEFFVFPTYGKMKISVINVDTLN